MSADLSVSTQELLNEKLKISRFEDRPGILRKSLFLRNVQKLRVELMEFRYNLKNEFDQLTEQHKGTHTPVDAQIGQKYTELYNQGFFLWAKALRDLTLEELNEKFDEIKDGTFEETEPTSATKTLDLLYKRIDRLGEFEGQLMGWLGYTH